MRPAHLSAGTMSPWQNVVLSPTRKLSELLGLGFFFFFFFFLVEVALHRHD